MKTLILSICLCAVLALRSHAQVTLAVMPTNSVVHVYAPVTFEVAVQNLSTSEISGIFILNGAYHGFEIDIVKIDNGSSFRFYNALMRDALADDIMFNPVVLKPGEKVVGTYCILRNAWTDTYVFAEPGEYEIRFRLLWNPKDRVTASATMRVTVLEWKTGEDKEQIEALNIWRDQHIAAAFQDGAELSDSSLGRLRKLAEDYPETMYGKLASNLLER